MKRKLTSANKILLSKRFTRLKHASSLVKHVEQITFSSIAASKLKGQRCYEKRIRRQERMNPRQLKKCRKKQRIAGLIGSRYGGMCTSKLRPAGFISLCNTDLNIHY